MPRTARKISSSGVYHVMLRGINRQPIFTDDEDNIRFLQILRECKKVSGFELYGYCLMSNHVHLLLKVANENLGQIFKRFGSRYVSWYNRKHRRCGHLFQDRYKSEVVEDDAYFSTVLRYIHTNPWKAGLCKYLGDYKWSSYNEYLGRNDLVDCEYALEIIGKSNYVAFMNEEGHAKCLEYTDHVFPLTDEELTMKIEEMFGVKTSLISNMPKEEAKTFLRGILEINGVSTRQLSRVTGISSNYIWKL
jgi:REP element-mobilizing transposase RayT